MNDVDYGAESKVEIYGEDRDISLDYDRLVKMGGWDLDFFNKAVAGFGVGTMGNEPQDVMDLMVSFVNTEFERAWSTMEDLLATVVDDTVSGPFAINRGEYESDRQRFLDFEIAVQDALVDAADQHANQALRLVDDEVATIYTAGGCYLFEEPVAYPTRPSSGMIAKMLPHLFRFQTNLFFSTVILYIEELDTNRIRQSADFRDMVLKEDPDREATSNLFILDLVESEAIDQRRLGETP